MNRNWTEPVKVDSLPTKMLPNNILIKITEWNDKIPFNDNELYRPTDYVDGEHVPRWGIVVDSCDKLIATEEREWRWVPHTLLPEKGDIAYFDFANGVQCEKLLYKDEIYYMLDYMHIYCYKRKLSHEPKNKDNVIYDNGWYKIFMVNGWILLEQEEWKYEGNLKIPKQIKSKKNSKIGVVAFAGPPNIKYYEDHNVIADFGVGDKVMYISSYAPKLEYHPTLNGNKEYVLHQRKSFLCKIYGDNVK
jgi:hypothetical protein